MFFHSGLVGTGNLVNSSEGVFFSDGSIHAVSQFSVPSELGTLCVHRAESLKCGFLLHPNLPALCCSWHHE